MFRKNAFNLPAIALIAGLALLSGVSTATASVIVLDFEGAGNLASLLDFYNGGTDSLGNAGVNYGIQFGSNALSILDSDAGGTGNFANEPSPSTVMFFQAGTAILNYAPGFDTGFSFYYTSLFGITVNIWDGLNGAGNLIDSMNLSPQHTIDCEGDPFGDYCNWTPIGVSFIGTARSVDFVGEGDGSGYDDVTLGSATPGGTVPVPVSDTLALLGLSLAALGYSRRKRKQLI